MEFPGTQNSQNNAEKEYKVEEFTLPDLKFYCIATVIKIVWY